MSPPDDAVLVQRSMSNTSVSAPASQSRPVRFTSNIVGPIFLLADLLCLLVSIPVALLAYDLLVGDRVIFSPVGYEGLKEASKAARSKG